MSSSIGTYTPQSWSKQIPWGKYHALTQRSIYEFLYFLMRDCAQLQFNDNIELECRLDFKQHQEQVFFILLNLMQSNKSCEIEYSLSENELRTVDASTIREESNFQLDSFYASCDYKSNPTVQYTRKKNVIQPMKRFFEFEKYKCEAKFSLQSEETRSEEPDDFRKSSFSLFRRKRRMTVNFKNFYLMITQIHQADYKSSLNDVLPRYEIELEMKNSYLKETISPEIKASFMLTYIEMFCLSISKFQNNQHLLSMGQGMKFKNTIESKYQNEKIFFMTQDMSQKYNWNDLWNRIGMEQIPFEHVKWIIVPTHSFEPNLLMHAQHKNIPLYTIGIVVSSSFSNSQCIK